MRQAVFVTATNHKLAQSVNSGWAFRVSGETRSATTKKGDSTMGNKTNGNQFRDDEILVLDQLREGKSVKNIFPKIGGRLRLAHEENEQLSISTEIVRYDEAIAVVRATSTTMKGNFPGHEIRNDNQEGKRPGA